jgi:hypothetical protein
VVVLPAAILRVWGGGENRFVCTAFQYKRVVVGALLVNGDFFYCLEKAGAVCGLRNTRFYGGEKLLTIKNQGNKVECLYIIEKSYRHLSTSNYHGISRYLATGNLQPATGNLQPATCNLCIL